MMIDTHTRLVPLARAGSESQQSVARSRTQPDAIAAMPERVPQRDDERETSPAGDIATAVNQLNKQLQEVQSNLQFSIHEASGRVVVKVIDTQNDEVIRQIPSEAILALAENAENLHRGKVLDELV